MQKDDNTENRIKETAKKLFQEKGFDAVRTREIAEAAGINSALLHYYFRSKERLFHIVMIESITEMFSFLQQIINNPDTSLSQKIDLIVDGYMGVIKANPNLALFVLNELHVDSGKIIKESGLAKNMLTDSSFFEQMQEQLKKKSIKMSPLQIMLNTISLSVMPVIAQPMIVHFYDMEIGNISDFLEERRKLIPMWIKGMLQLDK
ncbi:MAG: TetR/AcrR family transcriptional regulator [Prevotella sp.]|nr:TetR/AcrR family transcriptional regulator [Prevotella sp.]